MFILLLTFLIFSASIHAQATLTPDEVTIQKARVVSVSDSHTELIPGSRTPHALQTLSVTILDGAKEGQTISFKNDYVQLASGDTFYLRHTSDSLDSRDFWSVADPYRLPTLMWLAGIFLLLIVVVGGVQGIRGLASFIGSIGLIFFVLIPGILQGYSPLLVSVSIAGVIIVLGSYITHGFNRTTSAAVLGMIGTVCITGALGYWAVHAAHLSGFNSEESTYLNLGTAGGIDLVGLLFGGIMIGLLGVLYDIAIGQAIAVEELIRGSHSALRSHTYSRALRIGREHIGALVNTLAIAYVGVSLPLLLLIQSSSYDIGFMLNSEIFATEIIRILIGSVGLVLAVPITTALAVHMLHGKELGAIGDHSHHQ